MRPVPVPPGAVAADVVTGSSVVVEFSPTSTVVVMLLPVLVPGTPTVVEELLLSSIVSVEAHRRESDMVVVAGSEVIVTETADLLGVSAVLAGSFSVTPSDNQHVAGVPSNVHSSVESVALGMVNAFGT
jgi:hypothetical protein